MTEYKKPHLKLGEVLMLLGEDHELIEVLNEDCKVEFQGDLGEIRHKTDTEHYNQLKERYVREINFNDYGLYVIYLEPREGAEESEED